MKQKVQFSILFLLYFSSVKSAIKYTENELETLKKFRHMVDDILYKDYMKQDKYLIRWLAARDMNIQKASEMLREAIKWRKENNIDSILSEVIFTLPLPPFYTDGIDNSGSPVTIFIPGRVDIRRSILGEKKRLATIRFWDQFLEFGEVGVQSLAKNNTEIDVNQVTIIFDLDGYDLGRHGCLQCISIYFEWIKHYENYYPGLCKNLIFINAPGLFMPLIEMQKAIMSKETKKVLKLYGPNKEEWIPVLHKFIAPNQLRQQYGGTMPE